MNPVDDARVGGDLLPPGLTPSQKEAITAQDRQLSVLAGAGAGKTRVLTLRVAQRVIVGDADPSRILVCTFTRKAAEELHQRLWRLEVDGVQSGTFHRLALSLLRQHRSDQGSPAPVVLADRRGLLQTMLSSSPRGVADEPAERRPGARAVARSSTPPLTPARLDSEIGWAKATLVDPVSYEGEARLSRRKPGAPLGLVGSLYRRYEEIRSKRGVLDLDDLLLECLRVLEDHPTFTEAVRWRYRHLFVDEMQDVNPAQFRLLEKLLGPEPDLFAVGDPNQSIYGWNGADPSLLDRLPELIPGTRVIRLEDNHRCTPQIVHAASAVLNASGTDFRSTRPNGPRPRITVHETDIDEAEWVAHQAWLTRGPGQRWSHLAVLARTNAQLTIIGQALYQERIPFRRSGREAAPAGDIRVHKAIHSRDHSWPDKDDQIGDSEQLEHDWALDQDASIDEDAVVLSTFHRAKGLQWPVVFVVGLSEGLMPISSARDKASLNEEKRLLYVALTRAEQELSCSWASFVDDRSTKPSPPREPCRWLADVDRAGKELEVTMEPLGPEDVVAQVAKIRSRINP